MKFSIAIATFSAFLAAASAAVLAPLEGSLSTSTISGHYIVVLKPKNDWSGMHSISSATQIADSHHAWLDETLSNAQPGNRVGHKYDIDELRGYSCKADDDLLEKIRSRPEVLYVERDQMMSIDFNTHRCMRHDVEIEKPSHMQQIQVDLQNNFETRGSNNLVQVEAPWGLVRCSHKELDGAGGEYVYPESAGAGVTIYIIDTGIYIKHQDFGGRAKWGKTIPHGDTDTDAHGHGTHCAGIAGGELYGIAKHANLVAVKVLRSDGYGSNSDVIAGVEYVIKQHRAQGAGAKSVANMSLGGSTSPSLDQAVNAAVKAGIHFAVAAGNESSDACRYSPSAAKGPMTVAASNVSDGMAYFSNFGKCVDCFGPGVDILSAWNTGEKSSQSLSGTSMASPHIAGIFALYCSKYDGTTEDIKSKIIEDGVQKSLFGVPKQTPNNLASTCKLL